MQLLRVNLPPLRISEPPALDPLVGFPIVISHFTPLIVLAGQ